MNYSNAVKAFDAVREGKNRASKKEIALATGLSWGTMYKTVETLAARGVISPLKPLSGAQGRPSVPFRVNADAEFLCGIDIGSESTRILFCNLDFNILHSARIPTEPYTNPGRFFDWTGNFFNRELEKSGVDKKKLLGTGIAFSGIVDSENGILVSGGNFGMKRGTNLKIERFSERFGVPVFGVTTQVAAVCAEYHFGDCAHCGNLVTIGLGVGIGSGVIANHHLLVSHPDRPVGYIGHILIPGNPELCSCGFRGCLESWSGAHYLARIAQREIPARKELHGAAQLDTAASKGDADALKIMDRAAEYNAAGIAAMIQLYSPQSMIFSGGQCRPDSWLFRRTLEHLSGILPPERNSCRIEITTLGDCQSALGAARLGFERFF